MAAALNARYQDRIARSDGAAVASLAAKAAVDLGAVKDGWNGYGVLHGAASRVGALDLGFVPGQGGLSARQMTAYGTLDVLFLLGVDEVVDAAGVHHDWRADLIAALAKRQRPDGSWSNEKHWLETDPNLVTGYALMAVSHCKPKP